MFHTRRAVQSALADRAINNRFFRPYKCYQEIKVVIFTKEQRWQCAAIVVPYNTIIHITSDTPPKTALHRCTSACKQPVDEQRQQDVRFVNKTVHSS